LIILLFLVGKGSLMTLAQINLGSILAVIGAMLAVGIGLTAIAAAWVFFKVRRINLPAGTDFFAALRETPLSVVVLLDLLDFTFDIFSAPMSWLILSRLGLAPLRWVSTIEALIPGTEILPTMTISWVVARYWKKLRVPETISGWSQKRVPIYSSRQDPRLPQ
jgi:hypothetical protein